VPTTSLSKIDVNGVRLLVSESGAGEPLLLVHGSWVDRRSWSFVEEELARSFHVFSYDRIDAGQDETAARTFAELVAGPGAWDDLPADQQAAMIQNAGTFAGESRQPDGMTIDLDALAAIRCPVLLSQGELSPPFFRDIVGRVAEAVPGARVRTFAGAGHVPHRTHPEEWATAVAEWLARD